MIGKKAVEKVDLNGPPHKENLLFFLLYLYEMMDINQTECGNHFTIDVNRTIMLYTLNLHSDDANYLSIKLKQINIYIHFKETENELIITGFLKEML